MRITLDQYPGLTQNIATLATVDLSDNDMATLLRILHLLDAATANIHRALGELDAERYERELTEPPF